MTEIEKPEIQPTEDQEPDVIPAEQARAILEQAIESELGEGWDADDSKWIVVSNTDYMARLNKGRLNVDFYIDFFTGEVDMQVKEVQQGIETGKIFAWVLLGLFAAMTLIVARALGYI